MTKRTITKRGDVLAWHIRKYSLSTIVEIGVWRGGSIELLFENPKTVRLITKYWGVDPYTVIDLKAGDRNQGRNKNKMAQEQWDDVYSTMYQNIVMDKPQVEILRMTSLQAALLFPDNYHCRRAERRRAVRPFHIVPPPGEAEPE